MSCRRSEVWSGTLYRIGLIVLVLYLPTREEISAFLNFYRASAGALRLFKSRTIVGMASQLVGSDISFLFLYT